MRIKFFAAVSALAITFLHPLPSRADWRDTLIRIVGPPLVNRSINYLFSSKHTSSSAKSKPSTAPPKTKPSAPVVSHSVPKQTSGSLPRSTKLEVPPPPQTLVPPPPPGVPTGAVLGLYPQDMNEVYAPPSNPKISPKPTAPSETASMPKVAPDFRKAPALRLQD